MHFVDSHEDMMVLSATLDQGLHNFLKTMESNGHFENSVVILVSDHGLHYGPNFPTRQGRREAT
jgi:membrane-anchored protein YejM (alkaline phosphatase superfamily)